MKLLKNTKSMKTNCLDCLNKFKWITLSTQVITLKTLAGQYVPIVIFTKVYLQIVCMYQAGLSSTFLIYHSLHISKQNDTIF